MKISAKRSKNNYGKLTKLLDNKVCLTYISKNIIIRAYVDHFNKRQIKVIFLEFY